jgi:hypothetical protein
LRLDCNAVTPFKGLDFSLCGQEKLPIPEMIVAGSAAGAIQHFWRVSLFPHRKRLMTSILS